MSELEKLNYVEFAMTDVGPDYRSFSNEGLDGGFFTASQGGAADKGSNNNSPVKQG